MRILEVAKYEERADLALLELEGQPVVIIAQVGEALEYEGDSLTTLVRQKWANELIEGTDFVLLEGEALAELKRMAPGLVGARAASVMLLTESGLNLVLMRSDKPKARPFRRWLASEVLPQLRRTGSYALPGRAAPTPPLVQALGEAIDRLPARMRQGPADAVLDLLLAEAAAGRELPAFRAALLAQPKHVGLPEVLRGALATLGSPLAWLPAGPILALIELELAGERQERGRRRALATQSEGLPEFEADPAPPHWVVAGGRGPELAAELRAARAGLPEPLREREAVLVIELLLAEACMGGASWLLRHVLERADYWEDSAAEVAEMRRFMAAAKEEHRTKRIARERRGKLLAAIKRFVAAFQDLGTGRGQCSTLLRISAAIDDFYADAPGEQRARLQGLCVTLHTDLPDAFGEERILAAERLLDEAWAALRKLDGKAVRS